MLSVSHLPSKISNSSDLKCNSTAYEPSIWRNMQKKIKAKVVLLRTFSLLPQGYN